MRVKVALGLQIKKLTEQKRENENFIVASSEYRKISWKMFTIVFREKIKKHFASRRQESQSLSHFA